ncbi:hypothetical protein DV737_g507, partial [Chaetothyriales sp. CBS 132003]
LQLLSVNSGEKLEAPNLPASASSSSSVPPIAITDPAGLDSLSPSSCEEHEDFWAIQRAENLLHHRGQGSYLVQQARPNGKLVVESRQKAPPQLALTRVVAVHTTRRQPSQGKGRNCHARVTESLRLIQENSKKIALPTRVEPKVFFANERTFLSWLNFTVILGGLAVGLLNFGDSVGRISAGLFTLVAMGAMLYALTTFHWRARSIRMRGQGGFDDRIGPTVLALALLAAVIVNFVLRVVEAEQK